MRISDWSSDVCSSDLPLLFAARQLQPALADLAFIAMGQAHDQSVDGRAARRRFHLGPGRAVPPIADVVADAVVEQHRVLRDDSDRAAQRLLRHVANVLAVNGDPAGCYIIKEIGSASCWERVCQYVEISVVAGTLKK